MRKSKTIRRFLAAFLAALLCVTNLCPAALAAEADPAASPSQETASADSGTETDAAESTASEPDTYSTPESASIPPAGTDSSSAPAEPADPESTAVTDAPEADSIGDNVPLSEQAQRFIDAVHALDREALLRAANLWGLANKAWAQDTGNPELKAALDEATEQSDEAAARLYAAEDLYYEIPEDEQDREEVQEAYTEWVSLVTAMHMAMDNPTNPIKPEGGNKPTDDEIAAILCGDLPDAPTGYYMGSYGLPVHTGETKIGLGAWRFDLGSTKRCYMDAEALNNDNITITVPLQEGKNYAIASILAQVEYPANGSTTQVVLPDHAAVLSQNGTGTEAGAEEAAGILNSTHVESSADVSGFFVKASEDFTARLIYTAPDGTTLEKALHVHVDKTNNEKSATLYADAEPADYGAAATFADRPVPSVTTGKITKVAKVNDSWLIWFNGEPAYCCTHGANGQPEGCPLYTYALTSYVEAKDYIPGDHYGNRATCSATSLKR